MLWIVFNFEENEDEDNMEDGEEENDHATKQSSLLMRRSNHLV